MNDKIKRIQVPNKYIDNKEFNNNSFYLYVMLKLICVDNNVKIYKDKLLNHLQWTHYQLKKYLKDLKKHKLINYDFDELPKFKPIEIKIKPIKHHSKSNKDYFTQVDINTINKIVTLCNIIKIKTNKEKSLEKRNVREKALRLFYLYEMYYNESYGYAFISYEKIKSAMDINNTYINKINKKFNDNCLVEVDIGSWSKNSSQEEPRKYPNKYTPYCDRAKKTQNENQQKQK